MILFDAAGPYGRANSQRVILLDSAGAHRGPNRQSLGTFTVVVSDATRAHRRANCHLTMVVLHPAGAHRGRDRYPCDGLAVIPTESARADFCGRVHTRILHRQPLSGGRIPAVNHPCARCLENLSRAREIR
jgi:hypothetical protein